MGVHPHFRAYARQPVHLKAMMSTDRPGREHRVRVINLNPDGACVEGREGVPRGARVQLKLTTPHLWDPVLLGAEVVWSANRGEGVRMGVHFAELPAATLHTLVELLDHEEYD